LRERSKSADRRKKLEARQTLTGGSVSKGLTIVLALSAAVALAAMGAVITRDLGRSGASAQPAVHAAPGTVLRQDNPVQGANLIDRAAEKGSSVSAPAATHIGRSSGNQSVEGSALGADGNGPQSDLTRVLPTAKAPSMAGYDLGGLAA
jgi:hypothetical protein